MANHRCHQCSADIRSPARLIVRRLERYPHAAHWGFHIPFKQMITHFNKTAPPDIDKEEHSRLVSAYTFHLFPRLQNKCNKVWPAATNSPTSVYARDDRYGEKGIFSIVKSTRRDDAFVPPPDKVEEFRKIFVEEGFTDVPGWFRSRD